MDEVSEMDFEEVEAEGTARELPFSLDGEESGGDVFVEVDKLLRGHVGRLHVRLDEIQRDVYGKLVEPLLKDVVLFYDGNETHISDIGGYLVDPRVMERRDVTNVLRWFEDILKVSRLEYLETLSRGGVTLIEDSTDLFDPSIQRGVGVMRAPSAEEDGKVARVVRRGFRYDNGRVLRPEEVIVFRAEKEGTEDENE